MQNWMNEWMMLHLYNTLLTVHTSLIGHHLEWRFYLVFSQAMNLSNLKQPLFQLYLAIQRNQGFKVFNNVNRFPSGINTSCFHGDFVCSAPTESRSSCASDQPAALKNEASLAVKSRREFKTKFKKKQMIHVCLHFHFALLLMYHKTKITGETQHYSTIMRTWDHFTNHCIINLLASQTAPSKKSKRSYML